MLSVSYCFCALWQECASTSGRYLKIRIFLRCGAPDNHIRAGQLIPDLNELLMRNLINSDHTGVSFAKNLETGIEE